MLERELFQREPFQRGGVARYHKALVRLCGEERLRGRRRNGRGQPLETRAPMAIP
jgi:hypothetical protein